MDLIKGEKYLVVGPSGGGKSTLLKLLRKYFNPTKGEILIDGKNLKDIKKASYFSNISNVEQQVFLFEDTLKNNITLYKDYSQEEIDLAIKRAGLSNFVEGLQNKLDTTIYDNGKNISGGERSRVAIARGLLAKSDIIFLDEAFASLDSKVAKEIEKTLLDLDDVTIVNVSHVIFEETKERYDKVFVVKNKAIA
jgi:ATP-binding cassette subfamily C protein